MPSYIYCCPDCDFEAEIRHSIATDPEVNCESCGALMKRRPVVGSAPLVKGGTRLSTHQRQQERREHADMSHARTVASYVKNEAQPKARAALDRVVHQVAKEGFPTND